MAELPPKLFFRIGEVAGLVGVEPHVLRYWEREFRSIRPTKSAKGQRVYSRKDVENLIRVRELLYRDGFTIAGAKKKLQRPTDEHDTSSDGAAERERDDDEQQPVAPPSANVAPVVAAPRPMAPSPAPPRTREKLLALRAEVEAFLEELTPRPR
jgi:DNA-binding transcriptional MerR regulator